MGIVFTIRLEVYLIKLTFQCSIILGCLTVDSLRFLVLGDWGGLPDWPFRTLVEQNVAKQMAAVTKTYGTKFNLALGDNFYYDGVTAVNDGRFQVSIILYQWKM